MNIPDAGNEDHPSDDEPSGGFSGIPPLVIGPPFAMASELDFLDERPGVHPGCVAIVQCEGAEAQPCKQIFKIPLLEEGVKTCPKCGKGYTHLLLIAPADDDDIIADAMGMVLRANGYPVPERDDDQGDDQGDDEG